jgi:hypothetical protein
MGTKMKANQEEVRASQGSLIAMIRASQERLRAAINSQDYPKELGNQVKGARGKFGTQLAEVQAQVEHGGSRNALTSVKRDRAPKEPGLLGLKRAGLSDPDADSVGALAILRKTADRDAPKRTA